MAQRYESRLLGGDFVDNAESGELVDRLACVLCQLYKNLESYFDLDHGTKDIEEFTDALGGLKLNGFFFLRQARLNVLDEGFGGTLVDRRVV